MLKSVLVKIIIASMALDNVWCSHFDWSCYKNETGVVQAGGTRATPPVQVLSVNIIDQDIARFFLNHYEARVFTSDNCGVDMYIHAYWMIHGFGFVDQDSATVKCQAYDMNRAVQMDVILIRVGDPNDGSTVSENSHPLPEEWFRSGPLVLLHFTRFTFINGLILSCIPKYFDYYLFDSSTTQLEVIISLIGCPNNTYGGDCSHDCSCENGGICHDFNGACFCQKGWMGINCTIPDPLVEISKKPEMALYTGNVTLTCVSYGMTSQTMTWTKNGKLIGSTDRYTLHHDGNVLALSISHVQHEDDGYYVCSVENSDGQSFHSATNLTSSDHQSYRVEPNDVTVVAGDDTTFQCEVANKVGELHWYVDDDILLAVEDNIVVEWAKARFSIDSDPKEGRYYLNIQNVSTQDDHEYHCEVGPALGQKTIMSKFAQLTVLDSATDPIIEEAEDFATLSFLADSPVTVTCRADSGKPPARINWYRNGKLVTTNITTKLEVGTRNRMNTVSILSMLLTYEDVAGNITCEAWNDILGYRKVTSVTLEDLKYKPRVSISYQPQIPKEGDDIIFHCNVDANPDNITYRWTVNNKRNQENRSFLPLNKVNSDLKVICFAKNEIGDGYDTASVNIGTNLSNKWILMIVLCSCFGLSLVLIAPLLTYLHRYKIQHWLLWHFGGCEENDGKTFDAFVSYKGGEGSENETDDEKFVHNILIPELEKDGKYTICEHHRNFVPGIDIVTNIIDAINASRRTILILSPGFVESEWCRFEFLKAQEEMLKKKTKIIPIMFEDISSVEDMDSNLKSLLREISYITWSPKDDGNRFWDNMKYAMPRKRPIKNDDAKQKSQVILLNPK